MIAGYKFILVVELFILTEFLETVDLFEVKVVDCNHVVMQHRLAVHGRRKIQKRADPRVRLRGHSRVES